MSNTSIQAVTFDVGGTLIECCPSVGHIYSEEAARFGFTRISPGILNQRFAAAWSRLADFRHTRAQWCSLVDETFLGLTPAPPSQTFFAQLFNRFARPDAWRIFEDVHSTLDTLASRGLKLGIISNWDDRLRPLIASLKLENYFQTIVVSCEVGEPKPRPAIFAAAVSGLGLPPEAILHVGDSLELDVLGARSTRLQALLLDRGPAPAGHGQIDSLARLVDLI